MKKSTLSTIVIVVILVIVLIVWYSVKPSGDNTGTPSPTENTIGTTTLPTSPSVPVSETTKVSGGLSEYKNDELGFSLKYPTDWEHEEGNAGVNFIIPIDKDQVSTVATLQANVQVLSGTCAFPPVTTIKDRGTLKISAGTLNTISMSNVVQGRSYFNRMYSLQKDKVCYMFSFASITQPLSSKNLTGSKATQAENNNKAIVTAADKTFTDMVKTFTFVVGPQGQDEAKVAPKK